MILVYTLGSFVAPTLAGVPGRVRRVGSLEEYLRRVGDAHLSVLSIGTSVEAALALIDRLRSGHPTHPVIIVATLEADTARKLALTALRTPTWVVWDSELDERLSKVIAEAYMLDPLRACYLAITRDRRLPGTVESSIRRIMVGPEPLRYVRQVCDRVGVPESTLRYEWKQAFGTWAIRPLLDWCWIMRALRTYAPGDPRSMPRHRRRALDKITERVVGNVVRTAQEAEDARSEFVRWFDEQFGQGF